MAHHVDVLRAHGHHRILEQLQCALVVRHDLEVHQLDIKTAFLNGILEEEVYVEQPAGYHEGAADIGCHLLKALYGLRQASRAWHTRLTEELTGMGFQPSAADPGLHFLERDNRRIFMLVYVDDILIVARSRADKDWVKAQLTSKFEAHDIIQTLIPSSSRPGRKSANCYKIYPALSKPTLAFDLVLRQTLWKVLEQRGMTGKVLTSLQSMHAADKACVLTHQGPTDLFDCNIGVKQGCPASPLLLVCILMSLRDCWKMPQTLMPHVLPISCLSYCSLPVTTCVLLINIRSSKAARHICRVYLQNFALPEV